MDVQTSMDRSIAMQNVHPSLNYAARVAYTNAQLDKAAEPHWPMTREAQ